MGELIFTLMPQLEVVSLLTMLKRLVRLMLMVVVLQLPPAMTLEVEMQMSLSLTTRMIPLLKFASADEQSLTISKQIDAENRVAPTLSSGGSFSVEYERSLGGGNSLTTTVSPNESIDMEWKDSEWTASISMPVDGTEIKGTNVSVKRDVSF